MSKSKIYNIYPSDAFEHVCNNASKTIETGIIIGYDKEGNLEVFGGGLLNKKRPVAKDWLFMVETFKHKLISGDYFEGEE